MGLHTLFSMKTKLSTVGLWIFLTTLPYFASANPWTQYLTPEKRVFCEEQMAPVLKLYQEGKQTEALEELEGAYCRAESQFKQINSIFFFYRIIWWEAQTRSGREDPEWGFKLYEFIHNRACRKNPNRAINIPRSDYILYENIAGCLYDVGKVAEARSWILKLEDSICEHQGLNTTDLQTYPDVDSLFPFIPEARNRDFPLYKHEVPKMRCNCEVPCFIYYPYLYGIKHIAKEAFYAGDWVRAAELSSWYLSYNDQYMKDGKEMREEVFLNALYVINDMAAICTMHDQHNEAIALYDRYIEQANEFFKKFNSPRYNAMITREVLKIETGTITDEALTIADQGIAILSKDIYISKRQVMTSQLNRARIYHARGHTDEAWSFVDQLLQTAKEDINPYLWTCILTTAIDLALDDGGTHPSLEEWLILALQNERLIGNKFAELDLYEKYAQLLILHGRFPEALQMQREAIRLAKAIDLPYRENKASEAYASYLNLIPKKKSQPKQAGTTEGSEKHEQPQQIAATTIQQTTRKTETIGTAPSTIGGGMATRNHITSEVEIQPNLSMSATLVGQPAFGRFYLYNPSDIDQGGTLSLSGNLGRPEWKNEDWLTLGADQNQSLTEWTEPMTLTANSCRIIDITGIPETGGNLSTVYCTWIPLDSGQDQIKASWNFYESTSEKRTAVIDAHEMTQNPFYLIPIRHMIQQVSSENQMEIDVSIQASQPMRIEIYNERTGKLAAIDANGDGDFEDAGDLIATDYNRNNWPDITFEPEATRSSMILYVRPLSRNASQQEIELTVRLLVEGEWQTDAIDTIWTK